MATVIARLPVEDFDTWHAEYQRMHEVRQQHGERGRTLYRDVDDPDTVVVVFDWDTVDNAKGYFDSAALRDSVQRAHGRTSPTVHYLTRA